MDRFTKTLALSGLAGFAVPTSSDFTRSRSYSVIWPTKTAPRGPVPPVDEPLDYFSSALRHRAESTFD